MSELSLVGNILYTEFFCNLDDMVKTVILEKKDQVF